MPLSLRAAAALERARREIVEEAVDAEYRARPEYWGRFGPEGRRRCVEDTGFHVSFLACALTMGDPGLFLRYVAWLVPMLASRGIPPDDVVQNLDALSAAVRAHLPADEAGEAEALLASGRDGARAATSSTT